MGAVSSTCCCPGRQMEPDITIPVFTERVFSEENVFSAEQEGLTEVRQRLVELSRQTGNQGSKIQEMMDMIGVLHAELQQQRKENQQLSALLLQGGELDGIMAASTAATTTWGSHFSIQFLALLVVSRHCPARVRRRTVHSGCELIHLFPARASRSCLAFRPQWTHTASCHLPERVRLNGRTP
jgi:hypothetical protein